MARATPPVPSGDPPDGISKSKSAATTQIISDVQLRSEIAPKAERRPSGPAITRNRQTATAEKLRQERPICSTAATLAAKLHSERHKNKTSFTCLDLAAQPPYVRGRCRSRMGPPPFSLRLRLAGRHKPTTSLTRILRRLNMGASGSVATCETQKENEICARDLFSELMASGLPNG